MALGATDMSVYLLPKLNPNPPPNCTFCQKLLFDSKFWFWYWADNCVEINANKAVKIDFETIEAYFFVIAIEVFNILTVKSVLIFK